MSWPYARWERETLVIGNNHLERCLTARAGEPCLTWSFVNKETGRNYSRPQSREFCLTANGRQMTGHDFVVTHVAIHPGDPVEAIVYLSADQPAMAVELHYQVYSTYPVMRKWLLIRNRGAELLVISDLDWEDLHLLVDTPASAEVWVDYFTRREKAAAITMDDCALLVNDPWRGEGFILANEAPGPLKRLEVYAQPQRIAAGYNRDDETIFERILAPQEAFQTAACFLLTFANPIPQDVVDGDYARFVAEQLTRCDVTQVPAITMNTWVPFLFALDRVLLRQ